MASEKVYEPETINENPLPGEEIEYYSVSDGKSGGTHKPASISNESVRTKRVATELITTSLNTKSRKITGEYGFTKQGAIQVGEYDNGVSGEVKISPDGLVARNKSGITTFALDGDTGDATFAGRLQSGSLVTGLVAVGDSAIVIDGENKRILFYNNDVPEILIGQA